MDHNNGDMSDKQGDGNAIPNVNDSSTPTGHGSANGNGCANGNGSTNGNSHNVSPSIVLVDLVHEVNLRSSLMSAGVVLDATDVLDAQPQARPPAEANNSEGQHEADAWPFRMGSGTPAAVARMPVERDSEVYNMNHRKRGVAILFNHMQFDQRLGLKERKGTDADRDNLRATLRSLDFDVRVFNDLTHKEMERLLEDLANEDHSESDCLIVSVLSHGELGILYASDYAYKPDRLWYNFTAERCPTLAGKPKLFFVQACQGDQLDGGVRLKPVSHRTETDSNALSYKIPSHADFLIAYSTIPGFYSWRNTTQGSWFMQALCQVLQQEADKRDLLSMMTRVARKVALEFQSNTPDDWMMHEKKQIPCITSMLTRDLYFTKKNYAMQP